MEAATRFELVNSGFAVYLIHFIDFLSYLLILSNRSFYQRLARFHFIPQFIVLYLVWEYYGSKMVAV